MGEAYRTTNVSNDWLRLFNAYKKKNFKPFKEYMTD